MGHMTSTNERSLLTWAAAHLEVVRSFAGSRIGGVALPTTHHIPREPRTARLPPIPRRTRGQARAARQRFEPDGRPHGKITWAPHGHPQSPQDPHGPTAAPPRTARLAPIPRRSRGQARAARQPRHHVLALDSDKRLCYQGGPNARRHCMSTARVSAIPTPRSATCRGRCRGRCRAARRTGTIGLIKPRAW